MDISYLEVLAALDEADTFDAAAALMQQDTKLFREQVAQIEVQLGTKIIIESTVDKKRFLLTKEGRNYAEIAQDLLQVGDRAKNLDQRAEYIVDRQVDPLFPLVLDQDRIALALPEQTISDISILDMLKPDLIDLVLRRIEHFRKSPNRHQASHFLQGFESYMEILERSSSETPFILLWARGRKIISDFDAATGEIARENSEWVEFEPAEKSDLETFVDLHGQLMSLTHEGRQALSRAREQETTPETARADTELIQELVSAVRDQGNLSNTATQAAMQEVAEADISGDGMSQVMAVKYAVVASLGTMLFAGPAALLGGIGFIAGGTTTAVTGVTSGGAVSIVVTLLANESIKKSTLFESVRDDGTRRINALADGLLKNVLEGLERFYQARKEFGLSRSKMIRRVSKMRPEFRWMSKEEKEEQIEEKEADIPRFKRQTISLSESELELLNALREHFDTTSVNEAIRRSISQSSLLKRYSDELGDLVVERDGKKYVIPSRK